MSIIASYILPHPPAAIKEIADPETSALSKTIDAYIKVAKEIASLKPDTIIVSSPHSESYSDFFQLSDGDVAMGDFASFGAREVSMRVLYDQELTEKICEISSLNSFPAGEEGGEDPNLDHGTMIPLYFVNRYYKSYRIVRIGLSGLSLYDHYRMGMIVQKAVNALGRKAVFIASGDLSHCQKEDGPYGFSESGVHYDEMVMKSLSKGNFGDLFNFDSSTLKKAKECGHRSFTIMAGALDRLAVVPAKLSHEAPFGIGYGICSYHVTGIDPSRAFAEFYKTKAYLAEEERRRGYDAFLKLAFEAIEEKIRNGKTIKTVRNLSNDMSMVKAGAFVSIYEYGSLRGCMGTVTPSTKCLGDEIVKNAILAATDDPRFDALTLADLPYIRVSVDIVYGLDEVKSASELDPSIYGIVVSRGIKKGLVLPALPGINTPEEQIRIAKERAGIEQDAEVKISRFKTKRHE